MNFDDFFEIHAVYIYNYALRLSCNPSTAEDLAQETFLNAWKNREQLKNEDAAKSWLRKICFNIFLMKIRKEKIELSYDELTSLEGEGAVLYVASTEPSPEDEVIVDETIKDIQNGCFLAMARRLTLNQRIAFSMVDMFGLSIEEVSELLGLSKTAIRGLLYRARMNLDDFFNSRCNLIKTDNLCSCASWAGFLEHRDSIQKEALEKKLITSLDYNKSNYVFNAAVRKKVQYLYENIPEKKPGKEWYDNVINIIKEMY